MGFSSDFNPFSGGRPFDRDLDKIRTPVSDAAKKALGFSEGGEGGGAGVLSRIVIELVEFERQLPPDCDVAVVFAGGSALVVNQVRSEAGGLLVFEGNSPEGAPLRWLVSALCLNLTLGGVRRADAAAPRETKAFHRLHAAMESARALAPPPPSGGPEQAPGAAPA